MQPRIQKNISLKPYNTFGLNETASDFVVVKTLIELQTILSETTNTQKLFLGGGSNILLTQTFQGLVIKNEIKGKEIVKETDNNVWIKVYSGENWHQFVLHCVANNWAGIENLSLIPGTVGAAPLQNIGAYGVELVDVFDSLEALNLGTLTLETFNTSQCEFGYRESVFKRKLKDKYFIYSVTLKLSKKPNPNISYGDIKAVLEAKGIHKHDEINIQDISDAVIAIRSSKLPNPNELGNSGSFFKNPIISKEHFEQLRLQYPDIKGFEQGDNKIKIPAAWLIEQLGWKGKRVGNTGAHSKQALVLVNYGNATGIEIKNLAYNIIQSVKTAFGIELEPEVNFI